MLGSTLQPPAPIGPVFADALAKLLPEGLSSDTYNSQYLQRHSSSPAAILATAKVASTLRTPAQEVEATVFTALGSDVALDISVRSFILPLSVSSICRLERTENYYIPG